MQLFVNTTLDATATLVTSQTNNSRVQIDDIYAGDILDFTVTLVTGDGSLSTLTGSSAMKLRLGVGIVKNRNLLESVDLNYASNVYTGDLDFSNVNVLNQIGAGESVQMHMELQASFYNGNTETLMQMPFTLRQQLIQA